MEFFKTMIFKRKYELIFYTILIFLLSILFININYLSISYKEALNVFINKSLLSYFTNMSIYIFGQNDFALRLPFLLFYALSVLLMYKLTEDFFRYEKDRLIFIILFMFLPGILGASLLVNSSIIVLFFLLLYLYMYKKHKKYSYILLFFYFLIDNSFMILYTALFLHSFVVKNEKQKYISLIFLIVSFLIYGIDVGGKPRGYLLDTFAIYSSIFSPIIFIYLIYTVYRVGLKGKKTHQWYITTTALIVSFVFSFRQRIYIEDFAPYTIIYLPIVIKSFLHSYRVRLQEFRIRHNIAIVFTVILLVLNIGLTLFNRPLYLFLESPQKHFAYKYHIAKDLAIKLKEKGINSIITNDKELELRLQYYGIHQGNKYFLSTKKYLLVDDKIDISYFDKKIFTLYITKIK